MKPPFEAYRSSPAESESGVKKLEKYIETISAQAQAEGLPIQKNGRIDMLSDQYRKVYGNNEVERDFQNTREGQANAEELHQERLRSDGEKLEMLAHAIVHRNFGPDFVVARSSPFDDKKNRVDTIIFEKATGNLVCAFDEVSSASGVDYEKKQAAVQEHNLSGGASLKYGLRLDTTEGNRSIVADHVENVPLFYLALPKDRIEKGVREFDPDSGRQSDFEKKLFDYFIAAITLQIQGLELYSGRLNPDLRKKLQDFKRVVESLKSKQGGL